MRLYKHMHTTGQAEQLLAPLSEVVALGVLDPPCDCERPGSPARSSGNKNQHDLSVIQLQTGAHGNQQTIQHHPTSLSNCIILKSYCKAA